MQLLDQPECVAASDVDALGRTHRCHRIGRLVDALQGVPGVESTFVERRDVAVMVRQGVRHKQDGVDLTEVRLHFGHQSGFSIIGAEDERAFGLGILELRGDSDGLISAELMVVGWRFWLELRLTCADCAAVNLQAPARLFETLLGSGLSCATIGTEKAAELLIADDLLRVIRSPLHRNDELVIEPLVAALTMVMIKIDSHCVSQRAFSEED